MLGGCACVGWKTAQRLRESKATVPVNNHAKTHGTPEQSNRLPRIYAVVDEWVAAATDVVEYCQAPCDGLPTRSYVQWFP